MQATEAALFSLVLVDEYTGQRRDWQSVSIYSAVVGLTK